MLKLRNLTLLRRLYVQMLALMTRVAYGAAARDTARRARPSLEDSRIRRINSELELGPGAWEGAFLDAPPAAADTSMARDHPAPSTANRPGRPPFALEDTAVCVADAVDAILGDSLTRCFTAEPPEPWNFLTRNIPPGRWTLTPYMTLLWLIGLWVRYCVLLPVRTVVLVVGVLTFCIAFPLVKLVIPSSCQGLRSIVRKWLLRYLASVFVASWSGYIRFHGQRPSRKANQIYVANHTSLIDVIVLLKDYNFSFIGQRHGGLAGLLQDLLVSVQDHVWFDREEGRDRKVVQRLLKEHVLDGANEPMLVFPEGTCSTTEYCVMFKKGSFELGATVYPIAIRYRKEFGDAFWNSSLDSFARHFFDLMTSWAVVCNVYYLAPMKIQPGETSVQFAKRVKQKICQTAGLVDVNWDGFLKRHRISTKFLEQRQKAFAAIILRRQKGEVPRPFSSSAVSALPRDHLARVDAVGASTSSLPVAALDDHHIGTLRHRAAMPSRLVDAGPISANSSPLYTQSSSAVGPSARRHPSTVKRAAAAVFVALQNFFRWGVAFTLLAIATTITAYLIPTSWRSATTWRKALLPVS